MDNTLGCMQRVPGQQTFRARFSSITAPDIRAARVRTAAACQAHAGRSCIGVVDKSMWRLGLDPDFCQAKGCILGVKAGWLPVAYQPDVGMQPLPHYLQASTSAHGLCPSGNGLCFASQMDLGMHSVSPSSYLIVRADSPHRCLSRTQQWHPATQAASPKGSWRTPGHAQSRNHVQMDLQ